MPAHNAKNRDRDFTILVNPNNTPAVEFHNTMFIRDRGLAGYHPRKKKHIKTDDRGFSLQFYWHGNTRTWEITGFKLPYVVASNDPTDEFSVTKSFDKGLPKSQGDTLVRFLEWIESLVHGEAPEPNDELEPEEVQQGFIT